MAAQRVSRLQKQMLRWLLADHYRTRGVIASSHEELVQALGGDKGNISHSLRTLEARGWIVLGRTPGGRAESLYLTPAGLEKASEICL
jgi:DNA-binding MarR family transcriptional regulator